jgi:hypothetical protein
MPPTLPSSLPAACQSNADVVTMHGHHASTLPPCACLSIHVVEHQSVLTCLPLALALPSVLPIAFLALAQLARSVSTKATTGPSSLPSPHISSAILASLPCSSPSPPSCRSRCNALPLLEQLPSRPLTACARCCTRSGRADPLGPGRGLHWGHAGHLALHRCHSPPGSHPTGQPQPPLLSRR